MIVNKYLLFLIPFWLISHQGNAQTFSTYEGTVVTATGDTLVGLIKARTSMSEQIMFKLTAQATFQAYTPRELKSFRYAGGYYYKTMEVPGQHQGAPPVFLLCLVEGEVGLYQGPEHFYAEKPAGTLHRLEQIDQVQGDGKVWHNRRYANTLNYLMANCSTIRKDIETSRLNATSLAKVVAAYNYCINPSEDSGLTTEPTKIKLRAGIKSGVASSRINYFIEAPLTRDYQFDRHLGYVGGLLLDISFRDKFSVRPELLVTQRGGYYRRVLAGTCYEQINFSITSMHLPLSLYYMIPAQRLRPFVLVGMSFDYAIANDSYREFSSSPRKMDLPTDKDQYGHRVGGGVSYEFANESRLGLEYVYERSLTNGNYSRVQIHFITHSITATYQFRERKR